jgi:predicted nucleotidyltransferase
MKFDITKHIILLNVAGSRAYGIHKESSDMDMSGICVQPTSYLLGYDNVFEQFQDVKSLINDSKYSEFQSKINQDHLRLAKEKGCEGTVFSLQKFFRLASGCNPNIMDILFSDEENIVYQHPIANRIRDNRYAFLSKKAKFTYAGYAISQLKRIETHKKWLIDVPSRPERSDFDLPERTLLSKESLGSIESMIRKKMDQWEIDYTGVDDAVQIALREQIEKMLAEISLYSRSDRFEIAARTLSIDDNLMDYLMRERAYADALKKYKQYEDWRENRNEARHELESKFGYDTKHAAHLYRLLSMCYEILTTGKVNVNRRNIDADLIIGIRNGMWTYDQLMDFTNSKMEEIETVFKTCTILPKTPDNELLDTLCFEIQDYFRIN